MAPADLKSPLSPRAGGKSGADPAAHTPVIRPLPTRSAARRSDRARRLSTPDKARRTRRSAALKPKDSSDRTASGPRSASRQTSIEDLRAAKAQADADQPAERTERDGFDEKLQQDVATVRADGHADADLAGALGDADEHDVHDADAADDERDAGDGREQHGHGLRRARWPSRAISCWLRTVKSSSRPWRCGAAGGAAR